MNAKSLKRWFILFDFLTACCAWGLFYYYRKVSIEHAAVQADTNFLLGILIVPFFWLAIYFTLGTYNNIRGMYFMRIISSSLRAFLIGTLLVFFLLILNDKIEIYTDYYKSIFAFFLIQSVITLIPRLILTRYIVRQIAQRKAGFRTLLIGGSQRAAAIFQEINELPKGTGAQFIGFITLQDAGEQLSSQLPHLGQLSDLEDIIEKHNVEEVIIALDSSEQELLKNIISRIQGREIAIKIPANKYDILSGNVKMTNIYGALLIRVDEDLMPFWQFVVKRVMDVVVSLISMLILFPIYLILMIAVRSSSKGPIFFLQERIGKGGKPFNIIKFRTMVVGAEKNGPQLSSDKDKRITNVGRFMRKVRLDEIPQFWNVIKGDMSLVGPRPERQFFIDQILEKEPHFRQLNKVKPGITSWGQVKFGYAENVNEMIRRMKYDLLYLKNMSIALDLKIMLYTILIVFRGSGK